MLKKYKCSKCGMIGEAVSEICFTCPLCGAEMLQLEESQELKPEQKKTDNLTEAKVVSLGFYDLFPIPAGSKLEMFKQKLQVTKLAGSTKTKESSAVLKMLSEITYNPINDDILGNYKKQKIRQRNLYILFGTISFVLLLILFLCFR